MLLYLHGFNSAPSSIKARLVADHLKAHHPNEPVAIPKLATSPNEARDQILALARTTLAAGEPLRLMGSSLGGYLSSYLVETLSADAEPGQIRAVLVNPAVRPYELLVDYLGEQENPYTGERFTVLREHMDHLKALDTQDVSYPEAYRVLVQMGDEVLDPGQALARYQRAQMVVEPGGDHSFQGFERHLPEAMAFLGLV